MNTIHGLRRLGFGAAALAVSTAALVPAFAGTASAGQIQSRYIQMSNSTPGGGAIYKAGFTVTNAATNIGGIVIDFCSNTPIIGDACTAPNGMDVENEGYIFNEDFIGGGDGLEEDVSSTGNKLVMTRDTASAPTQAAISFEFGDSGDGLVINPSDLGTFYARIYTYATSAAALAHNSAAPTGYTDAGGVALSTANQINLTAKVQETLSFCVYTNANCGLGGTAVTLGDTNGVLRTSGSFVDKNTKYDLATNATSGAVVRFKAPLPTSGSNTLASIGNTGTAADALTSTTQFGLCSYRSTGALLAIDAVYGAGSCSSTTQTAGGGTTGGEGTAQFAFDTAAAASTYGDTLATMAAGDTNTGTIAYVGNVATTQPAGIYTNTFTFIATGTY